MSTQDLADHDRPITDIFESGSSAVALTDDQVLAFQQNGFISGIPVLTGGQVELLRSELDRMMQPGMEDDGRFYEYNRNESADPSLRLFHALGAWRVSEAFHDLIFMPRIGSLAGQLLGTDVRFWHDQVFVKPAMNGGVVAWHQDYSYWTRTLPVAHVTCWIGLDDSTIENGCVHYVPGSHKWGLLPKGHLSGEMDALLNNLTPDQRDAFKPVPAEMKAGEASFHHSMLVHGSFSNRSARPRRGVVINLISDGVVSDSDESLLDGVPPIPKGRALDGKFFPLVSKAIGKRLN